MNKVCDTCFFRELRRVSKCPAMNAPTKPECFAWCSDFNEWRKRISACRNYERSVKK